MKAQSVVSIWSKVLTFCNYHDPNYLVALSGGTTCLPWETFFTRYVNSSKIQYCNSVFKLTVLVRKSTWTFSLNMLVSYESNRMVSSFYPSPVFVPVGDMTEVMISSTPMEDMRLSPSKDRLSFQVGHSNKTVKPILTRKSFWLIDTAVFHLPGFYTKWATLC